METAVSLAVCQFSMGATSRLMLYKVLGIDSGKFLTQSSHEKDSSRIIKSIKASAVASKNRRKQLKYNKTTQEQKKKSAEGPMYSAGAFDVPK